MKVLPLADVDIDLDRIDRGYRGQLLLHGRANQVAQLGLGDAGDAVHRRADTGETEVQFRLLKIGGGHGNAGPGRLDPCARCQFPADGVVQVLFRDRVLGRQRPHPGQVGPGGDRQRLLSGQVTPCLIQRGAGLVDHRLEGTRVDLKEDPPFAHHFPFPVVLAQEVTAHLRPDDRVDRTVQRPHPLAVQGHGPLGHRRHRDHRHGRGRGLLLLAAAGEGRHHEERHNKQQACRLSPPGGSCACHILFFHQVPPPDQCCYVLFAVITNRRTTRKEGPPPLRRNGPR